MRRVVICSLVFAIAATSGIGLTARDEQGGGGGAPGGQQAQARGGRLPAIAERMDGLRRLDGFFPLYWDEGTGALFLEIPKLDTEVLWVTGVGAGMGSNDIGIDRAQLGGTHVVSFQRVGTKILMVEPNYDYRAVSTNPLERKAVEEAFAKSVLWGFTAIAETSGRVLVDLGDFVMRDTSNIAGRLAPAPTGSTGREAPSTCRTRGPSRRTPKSKSFRPSFPTVAAAAAAGAVAAAAAARRSVARIGDVVPSPEAMTVRQHHSFIELPDANYKPRKFDARAGYGGMTYMDFSAPFGDRHAGAIHPPPPAREKGSERGGERSRRADHLLRRSRRARADSHRARRRRALVEPGVRGRRIPQRASASSSCPKAPTRWTCATTPSPGSTDRRAAGATARRSAIRAPARSSRGTSRSARSARSRTT